MLVFLSMVALGGLQDALALKPSFVDFSDALAQPRALAVLGRLDKLREGKKRKVKDRDAHIGTGGGVSRISGAVYYRIHARARLAVESILAGKKTAKPLRLRLDYQLAQLPDGSKKRQLTSPPRPVISEEAVALWILAPAKMDRRSHEVLRAVVAPDAVSKDVKAGKRFRDHMRDLVAINQRIATLKKAVARARVASVLDSEAAIHMLEKALAGKIELLDPESDRFLAAHVGPWERRARELVRNLQGEKKGS